MRGRCCTEEIQKKENINCIMLNAILELSKDKREMVCLLELTVCHKGIGPFWFLLVGPHPPPPPPSADVGRSTRGPL